MDTFNDYVMHYVGLLDALGVDKVHLVGFSLGGLLAAHFASQQRERVKTLTLVAPAGMRSAEYPTLDVLATPGEKIVASLASNFDVLKPWLPTGPDPDFMGARYRETTTLARLLWEKPWDPKFKRYLHRIDVPTLIVWGDEDKLVPPPASGALEEGAAEGQGRRYSRAPAISCSTRSRKPPTPSPPSRRQPDPSRGPAARRGLATYPSPGEFRRWLVANPVA